jgi:hypothetical protein
MSKPVADTLPDSLAWLAGVQNWIEQICDTSLTDARDTILRDQLPGEWGGQGSMASYLAGTHAMLFGWTGDSAHLDAAREYVLLPDNTHTFATDALYCAVTVLRENGRLNPDDEAAISHSVIDQVHGSARNNLGRFGWRRTNHCITSANLADVYSRLWPDDPESASMQSVADEVWGEWTSFGDNMEDACNYEAFHEVALILWAERRGSLSELLEHPGTRQWIDRGIETFLPIGIMPGYGDTCTMELWPHWFALYGSLVRVGDEHSARRARWNMERMFEWVSERDWIRNVRIIDDVPEDLYRARQAYNQIPLSAWYMALGADEVRSGSDVVPEPPAAGPHVTHRWSDLHMLDDGDSWSLVPVQTGQVVSDKAILRMGSERESAQAFVGLLRQLWHDHTDSGAILNYSHGGTVLLDDNGYMQRYPVFHNLFWAAPSEDDFLGYTLQRLEANRHPAYRVHGLTGGETAQMISIRTDAPHGLPVRSERNVILTRSGPMIVRDRIEPWVDGLVGAPLWHGQTVHDHSTGPDGGQATMSVGEFRGMNGPAFPNANGRVVVATPFETGEWVVTEQQNPDPYANPGYVEPVTRYFTYWKASFVSSMVAYQPRKLVVGEPNDFITVLVPESIVENGGAAVTHIGTPGSGTYGACGAYVLAIADGMLAVNESEDTLSGSWGESDAALLWTEPGGMFAHAAQHVRTATVDIVSEAINVDADLQWDDTELRGRISSAREIDVVITLRMDGSEYSQTFSVNGITDISLPFR